MGISRVVGGGGKYFFKLSFELGVGVGFEGGVIAEGKGTDFD